MALMVMMMTMIMIKQQQTIIISLTIVTLTMKCVNPDFLQFTHWTKSYAQDACLDHSEKI